MTCTCKSQFCDGKDVRAVEMRQSADAPSSAPTTNASLCHGCRLYLNGMFRYPRKRKP